MKRYTYNCPGQPVRTVMLVRWLPGGYALVMYDVGMGRAV